MLGSLVAFTAVVVDGSRMAKRRWGLRGSGDRMKCGYVYDADVKIAWSGDGSGSVANGERPPLMPFVSVGEAVEWGQQRARTWEDC